MESDSASKTRLSLLARLKQDDQDPSAWNEFVARYGPRIQAWCRHWNLQSADDVTQMVLVRPAVKMRGFVSDPSRSFRGWLRTLTRHAWSDFVSDRQRVVSGSADSGIRAALHSLEARDDLEKRLEDLF